MKDYSIVRITQFAPDPGNFSVRDIQDGASNTLSMSHLESPTTGEYRQTHLYAIQNPKPATGNEGLITSNPEDWSDSPTLSPSLSDNLRYAYGRFGVRYGSLDRYHGVVIRQESFSNSGDYIIYENSFTGSRDMYHDSGTKEGFVSVYEEAQITGDVTVNQYNIVVFASPVPFSYKNPVSTDVSIRLSNYVYPLDSSTIELYIDGIRKSDLTITPFYGGSGGFDVVWANEQNFDYDEQVYVEWRVYDSGPTPPNQIIITYWFRTVKDYVGPRVSSISPADDATGISVDSCITFTLRDYEKGVSISTLELYVNNKYIEISDMTITETSTSDGYDIIFCPPENFLYGDEIPVSIYVEDSSEQHNYLFHVYSFTTEESLAPVVVDQSPQACREFIPINKDVEVYIVDGGHGLDLTSVVLYVDDQAVPTRKLPFIYREE